MADVAHEDAAIASEERNFIRSVIEFGDTIVREVMVPRIDMVDVPGTQSVRFALDSRSGPGARASPCSAWGSTTSWAW